MTDAELLSKVKIGLGITGTYQDETLLLYIEDVKNYLIDAGVSTEILDSSASVGVIIRGVSDLWNYGMGTANLSEYFIQRAIQLKHKQISHVLEELKVQSSPGIDVGTTQINILGGSTNAIYRYVIDSVKIQLPEYDEDLSDWTYWDGISEIFAEDGHNICIAEVTSENLARKAGITIVVTNLG